MDKIVDFTVFCLENYKQTHHMTGKDALETFNKNEVFDYIRKFYDVLYTFGERDIDKYIELRGN
ncbi:MAG: DUF3791 domain-containing protein [Anaeromicrobium sp.]|jgi:hypothetical protein|uniref:DUF3791 domain-containing protein n=1 Tax=Anaeromicrobium sp. TaxID=1929132 RepID=UPI0025F67D30|nr:DUF3791 domain-containing protein [Anaeromicrobium sp.]MCT4596149.1 DUF3791 domain-containing protein [Anaeromicrobium sp.]